MSLIERENKIIENEALLIPDERVDDVDLSSVKFEGIENETEANTENPVEKLIDIDVEKNEGPIRYSDLADMGYTLENSENSGSHSWLGSMNEELARQNLISMYRKDHPIEKKNHEILKGRTGKLFKTNISKLKDVGDSVDLFTKEDFEGFFSVSLDGKAVKLNIGDIKPTLTYYVRKLMNSGILTVANLAVSPENIVESILNNKPIRTNMLGITVVDSEDVGNIRNNIQWVLRNTFNQLQNEGYQVLNWEQDFKKVFGKV